MKFAARKSFKTPVARREQMLFDRARAAPLRQTFPQLGQLRIELIFSDLRAHSPSPQLHALYPPAPAFFRFACPCADCDGDFDLTGVVVALVNGMSRGKKTGQVRGQLPCDGMRRHNPAGSEACSMQLTFELVSMLSETKG